MKNTLIILVILTFSSCTKKIDLNGDWKASVLVVNNSDIREVPNFPITYFKSDNYVIYFESIYKYEIDNDSIAFYYGDNPTELKYKMGIDIVDDDNIIFYYDREIIDSTNSKIIIPYHSKWYRIK